MPWRTSTVEIARARFVMEAELSDLSHAELWRRHGITRPTQNASQRGGTSCRGS